MHSPFKTLGFGFAALLAVQSTAVAQFDASVSSIDVTQAINQNNSFNLAGGRSTFVRVSTALENPPTEIVPLDGLLRVFIDGNEAPWSPVYSDNGPYPARLTVNLNNENDTLNFIFVAPTSANVVLEAEINPAGPNFVNESNTGNNKTSLGPLNFQTRLPAELVYSPIDYRPNGGGPNLPPDNLILPAVGDNFLQGIYPTSDWFYHRTDAPSKLWTNSLSGTGGGLNNSLFQDLQMMVPQPDFIYGWVPGGLPYNGQAQGIGGNAKAAMGNTQDFKHQRTFAHEIGHLLGFPHNSGFLPTVGVDVEEALQITQGLPMIKPTNLRDIMVPGLNTNQAWVWANTWQNSFNHSAFTLAPEPPKAHGLSLTGIWNQETGSVAIDSSVYFPLVRDTQPVALDEANFVVEVWSRDGLMRSVPISVASASDTACGDRDDEGELVDSFAQVDEVSLVFGMIAGEGELERLEIRPVEGVNAVPATLVRSPNAPQVQFTGVAADGDVSAGQIEVSWAGDDADGDELTYYLRYTRNGSYFSPLLSNSTATSVQVDMSELPALIDGQGYFELFASDGLNTTAIQSPYLTGSGAIFGSQTNPPWVEIMTPDDGQSYRKGSTVLLHSSGWDLEDRYLFDAAIAWASDLDGYITNGRMTSTSSLSVGVHQLTVTATDVDGNTTTDTHMVTITDRGLPGEGAIVNYCTAGTSASGCQALLTTTGTPSASAATGFVVTANTFEGNKDGLFYYGTNGPQANPWGSGTSFQCVAPPTSRSQLITGSGTNGACDGSTSFDLNARWTAKPNQNPGAGAVVDLQFWYRDPNNTSNQTTSLSDAIEFTVDP